MMVRGKRAETMRSSCVAQLAHALEDNFFIPIPCKCDYMNAAFFKSLGSFSEGYDYTILDLINFIS